MCHMADIIDQSNMGMQLIEGVPGIKPAKRDRYDMIWYDMIWYDIFHFLYVYTPIPSFIYDQQTWEYKDPT